MADRSLHRFEGRSRFFTWLYRIGINEAKRRYDRRRPPTTTGSLDDSGMEIPDWRDAPEPRAERQDLRLALERAISALPPDYRLPLILRDIEGLSTTEAADVMDLGEAAFKSRLHRARMTVRELRARRRSMIRRWFNQRRFMREHAWTHVRLNDYVDGELAAGERHRVEEHVGLCPECRRVLQTLRKTVEGLMALRTPAPADLGPGIIERLRQEPREP